MNLLFKAEYNLCCAFLRAFATETTQFLAPFESSMKPKSRDSPTQACPENAVASTPMGNSASTNDVSHPIGKLMTYCQPVSSYINPQLENLLVVMQFLL